jgi:hypothetical protein
VLDLARAETARRVAAGEKIDSPEPFAKHLAREDPDRLLAEDAERRAVAEDTAALAGCSDCDRDGLRWWKTDGTPATRETPRALSERCDHAGNVVPIQAGAR